MSNELNLKGKKILLLAEKPSVMRAIQAIYNKKKSSYPYTMEFGAFHGHVMGLKSPSEYNPDWQKWDAKHLPMLPDFSYKPTDPKFVKDTNGKIRAGKYDYIVNACDAGREGELIFWAYYSEQSFKIPVIRYWANSNADSAIEKALGDLRAYTPTQFEGLKQSSFLRAQFDWLVGMNFSRGATIPIGETIAIGRVQSPTLKMVVDRELAIKNFKPEAFFEIEGDFKKGEEFTALNMVAPDFKQSRYATKQEAEAILRSLGKKGIVEDVKTEAKESFAPALFSLVELQKSANKAFKMTPDATLVTLQTLYENGFVTYPRTESRYLPSAMIPELPKAIKSLTALPVLGEAAKNITQTDITRATTGKRYIDDGRIEDHHAIIPTDKIPTGLSGASKNIYEMIVKQFLAIFLPCCRTNSTTILIDVDGKKFKTEGTVVLDAGYTTLLGSGKKDKILPSVTKGETIPLSRSRLKVGETTPPSRYTPATLLAAMQNAGKEVDDKDQAKILKDVAGIGTSATRASILEGLIKKKYMGLEKNFYVPSEFGIYNSTLLKDFDFVSPALTATWEKKLQEVEADPNKAKVIETEMKDYVTKTVGILKNLPPSNRPKVSTASGGALSVGKCPSCKKDVVEQKFSYNCTGCDLKISKTILGANITKTDMKAMLSGKETKPKNFKGKSKPFTSPLYLNGKELKFGKKK